MKTCGEGGLTSVCTQSISGMAMPKSTFFRTEIVCVENVEELWKTAPRINLGANLPMWASYCGCSALSVKNPLIRTGKDFYDVHTLYSLARNVPRSSGAEALLILGFMTNSPAPFALTKEPSGMSCVTSVAELTKQ
jgi:hypothetical protein